MHCSILLLPGDGIGPEVVAAAERVLRSIADRFNHSFNLTSGAIGGAALAQGLPPLPFGMALHLGDMLWGNIGTADRLDFTAIGPAVNLVSRLEGLCKLLGHSVLISGAVAAETSAPLTPLGEHALRGIALPCAVFTLAEH